MTTPVWAPGTLYQPGDLVRPRTTSGQGAVPPDDPSFESGGLTHWTATPVGGAASGALSTTYKFDGTYSFFWAGGSGSEQEGGIGCDLVNNFRAPVTPGQTITARAYFMSVPLHREHGVFGSVRLYWFNGSEELIATDSVPAYGDGGPGHGFGTTGSWVLSTITASAPPGAAFCSVGAFLLSNQGDANGSYCDAFTWDYISPSIADNLVFRAVQPAAGFSGSEEPIWPVVLGETVYDNEVTWEAVATSRVVWEATPILVSGAVEPDFPPFVDGNVVDNTIVWKALSRRITDPKCPHSKIVAIAASKIFAGDKDIIPYCSTVNPLDWSSPNDAGYLPFGLQTYGANPVAGMGLYRSNLVAFNATGYQMWQVDPNPTNMAFLDGAPIPCTYHLSIQPVSNDLVFLTSLGIRNISIAGASTNLEAGFFGKQVDPLVKALIAAAKTAGFDPWGLFWPGAGQYWLFFGTTAMVLTMNGGEKDMSWSRYIFPYPVNDWCIQGTALFLRAGDLIWEMSDDANLVNGVADDVYCDLDDAPVLSVERVGTSNHLSWTAVDGASGYRLYNALDNTLIVDVPGAMSLAYINSGLSELTDYRYYVRAHNAEGGESPNSNTVDSPIGGPSVPALDGEIESDHESALLSWTASTTDGGPILGYRLFDADTDTLIVDTMNPATLTYLDSGLASDTEYSYVVRSYTAQTVSAPSNVIVLDTGHPGIIIDIYHEGAHVWTKRPFLVSIDAQVWGSGGGGSGGRGASIADATHGGGGGGGAYAAFSLAASFLASTENVVVGQGGLGGIGGFDGDHSAGATGSTGITTAFGAWASCTGGAGGPPYTGSGPAKAAGGTAVIATTGPTSKVTETGGVGAQKEGPDPPGSTLEAGAGGGLGSSGTGGTCAGTGGDGGNGGAATIGSDASDGGDGGIGGGGGGGGGSATKMFSGDPNIKGGVGGNGGDGLVIITNHLS